LKPKGKKHCCCKTIEDYRRLDQEVEKHCCHKTQGQLNEEAKQEKK
jgi:hypothetical protein